MNNLNRIAEAKFARDAAMKRVEKHANSKWSDLMLKLVKRVSQKMHRFTADDVFDLYAKEKEPPTTHDPRAFGPVMSKAAKLGYCTGTGEIEKSRRKSCHHRPLAVWESLIYENSNSR